MAKIKLSEVFGNNIFTRRTISNLFSELNKIQDKIVEIDFSDVEFISRSCADEYIKQKKVTKKQIVEVNLSNNICSMFNVVKNQYEKAGFALSFDVCKPSHKKFIPA